MARRASAEGEWAWGPVTLWSAFAAEDPLPRRFYIPWIPGPRTLKRISDLHTWVYQKTRGWLGSRMDGLDMLLLTTTGRRSGQPRTLPLPYFRDGERYLLVASYGGSDHDPAWVRNLRAEPRVRLQVEDRRIEGVASAATGEERARLWAGISYEQPRYLGYQEKTSREIPIIVVEPRTPADGVSGLD